MADRISEVALAMPGAWPDEPWEGDLAAKVGPDGAGTIFAVLGADSIAESCARVVGTLPRKHRPEGWDT